MKALLIKVSRSLSGISTHTKALQSSTGKRRVNRADVLFHRRLGLIMCTMSPGRRGPGKTTDAYGDHRGHAVPARGLTVALGDTIVWVNKDFVPHTAMSEAGGFDSKDIQADKSWRHTIQRR